MIKKTSCFLLFLIAFYLKMFGQGTFTISDIDKNFQEAIGAFDREQYAVAYPVFQTHYERSMRQAGALSSADMNRIRFYYLATRLKLQLALSEQDAVDYISQSEEGTWSAKMNLFLAKFYFANGVYEKAINCYNKVDYNLLDEEGLAAIKFEKAYSLFNLKKFSEASTLFASLMNSSKQPYFYAANYYHGFIDYFNGDVSSALRSFSLVENHPDFKQVVPYYIAEIYYFQSKKDSALLYANRAITNGGLFYDKEIKLLAGQIYFEKKDYKKALPYLEYYYNHATKVSRENMYELSCCYVENNNLKEAVDILKQLSGETDSLGKTAMYLLGDCYLKLNDKTNARAAFQFCSSDNPNLQQQEVANFNYVKLSYELGYMDIATKGVRSFLIDFPNSVYGSEARQLLVAMLAVSNNFKEALDIYQSLSSPSAAAQKLYPTILYGRAVELMNDQQPAVADELLTKVLLSSDNRLKGYANFWKGEIAYRTYLYDNAIKYYSTFLQSNLPASGEANSVNAKYALGYCWTKRENYKLALTYFEQISKSSSAASALEQDAFVRSGDCYYMLRDFSKAANVYDLAVKNELTQRDYALFQKAMLTGIKNSSEKITLLNKLVSSYPQSSLVQDANMELADVYMADEKFSQANEFLNKILASSQDGLKPTALLKSGLCFYNQNNNEAAINIYKNLLKTYPQSAESEAAKSNIKSIYTEDGNPSGYLNLMSSFGWQVSNEEADSLTFTAAEKKYLNGEMAASINSFEQYVAQFPKGAHVTQSHYFLADCYQKQKNWSKAAAEYAAVCEAGLGQYYERSALSAARINYLELKDYLNAKKYYLLLKSGTVNPENESEALRGLVRCFYQLKDYNQSSIYAQQLLMKKDISTDDKAVAWLVLGKSQQLQNNYTEAINSFKSCAVINKSAWGAEARFEYANSYFLSGNITAAEKAAMVAIREIGGYDYWINCAYILLGDIFMAKKDFFNAKATYQSIVDNSTIADLKLQAQQKLDLAIEKEKKVSKLDN